jgi:cytochrome c biogenesis protein CcmG/thiol:disulfide interchange protein DsbE
MTDQTIEPNVYNDPYTDDPYADNDATAQTTQAENGRLISPFAVVIIIAAILLISVVAYGIYQNELDTRTDGPAPDFSIQIYNSDDIDFTDADAQLAFSNETIQLAQFEGNSVVVLNFWQSNCPPCHDEAPMLVNVYEDYRDQGVVFIGINAKDSDRLAHEYLAQYNITYPNGLDRGDQIQTDYRTTGYPETFIVDLNGDIQHHFSGQPSENQLRAEIDKALQSGNGSS